MWETIQRALVVLQASITDRSPPQLGCGSAASPGLTLRLELPKVLGTAFGDLLTPSAAEFNGSRILWL
jgi:hypothetical protein